MILALLLSWVALVSAYTTYNLGDPYNRQFYYYNPPPTDQRYRNYPYRNYNQNPSNLNNYDYGYGQFDYTNPNDPVYFNNQQDQLLPNYGYRQRFPTGYIDPYAPREILQRQDDYPKQNEIDVSGFKLHHQHHPNKDRVSLKPGHDGGGLHGVSFGNNGYGN